ncbi:MAG: hypothetical protein JRI23_22185 [Deltaproteobacteria bacterium]|jgi:hypothetical protein|nr:hypothetical protein [Deltaproteobacteria bacterium]MBW2534668.1 hypothetical protein [Deltaproteobacteria bacterium]
MSEQATGTADDTFEHSASFHAGEVSGNLQLTEYEVAYQKLFAEAIEDGVITADERSRLEKAAESLGLDRARIDQLELALKASYEAHHGLEIVHADAASEAAAVASELTDEAVSGETVALKRRVAHLESLLIQMQEELKQARAEVAIEVDLDGLDDDHLPVDDAEALQRRLTHDPRNERTLHALYRTHEHHEATDRQWCTAHALVYLDAANDAERVFYARHRKEGLIQPTQSLDATGWQRHLFHPEEELLTGQIFASVVSAVLLGRVSALKKAKQLPELDPKNFQHPTASTIQAVRCFSWSASILGMAPPPLYTDPSFAGAVEMVPGVPPASRLGKQSLSGRKPEELAFLAGQHLACYREERFVRQLFPDVAELQDLFLAALLIANPALPLEGDAKKRVEPVAKAVESLLQANQIDRLRSAFARFVEQGGRTNLQRWMWASDRTALRAGLLLCDDLAVAERMLEQQGAADRPELLDDLLVFCTSEDYATLREHLGIAVG